MIPSFLIRLRKAQKSPSIVNTIATIDNGVKFMMDKEYNTSNPAIAAVRGPIVAGFWVILVLSLITLTWGIFAPIESAAVTQGSVVLLSNKKTIQHLEGGIIENIFIKEGEKVVAGQELIKLSDTAASSVLGSLNSQLFLAQATELRLIAARDAMGKITFSPDMLLLAEKNAELAKALSAQERLFFVQKDAQTAKLDTLNQRIAESNEQVIGLEAQIKATNGQLKLLTEEIDTVDKLFAKGYATKPRLLSLQRSQKELEGNIGQYNAQIAEIGQNITATQMEITSTENDFATQNSQELRDTQAQVAELEEKIRAAKDVASRTIITAPVAGIITGLKYHTIGGVIAGGTPIMDIIPQDDPLIIEVRVKPADIGVVHQGLDANIRFTAYEARSTPKVPGKITQVSADKFTETQGLAATSYYLARIEVSQDFLHKLKTQVDLYPGMPVEALINTGSRPFLAYLFHPISASMYKAFREK